MKYENPVCEIVELNVDDVIVTSGVVDTDDTPKLPMV